MLPLLATQTEHTAWENSYAWPNSRMVWCFSSPPNHWPVHCTLRTENLFWLQKNWILSLCFQSLKNLIIISLINTMERSNILLSKSLKCVWATERNKMVQFEAMWQRVIRVLEMGVWAGGSGQGGVVDVCMRMFCIVKTIIINSPIKCLAHDSHMRL
jgi:hypothetical protein